MHEGDWLRVEMRVLDVDAKRYHLHLQMISQDRVVAVCEFLELHVAQKPKPHAAPMPDEIRVQLENAKLSEEEAAELRHRSRSLGLQR